MKKITLILSLIVSVAMLGSACSKAKNYQGKYQFDTDTFKTSVSNSTNPMTKDMPEEQMNLFMQLFASYNVEIQDTVGKLQFGNMSVEGILTKVAESDQEIKLQFTPKDEDKKDEPLLFIITGDKMVMDSVKGTDEKLYFKKVL